MTKMCNKWKRVNLGNNMYSQSLKECPFCGLRLIETYNFENTYIYCPKCGNRVIDKENEGRRMTREEAIFCEKSYIGETNCVDCKYYGTETCQSRESHKMAVEALEQEPILDKIRAEIKKSSHGKWYVGRLDGKTEEVLLLDEVLKIIDKYREESEGQAN